MQETRCCLKKVVSIVLLTSISILNPMAAFANTNNFSSTSENTLVIQQNAEKHESFTYEEDGKLYECVVDVFLGGNVRGEIYEINENGKVFYKDFCITADGEDGIYLNNKLVINLPKEVLINTPTPREVYPYLYAHGEIDFSDYTTQGEIAAAIYAALVITNPYIGISVAMLMPMALAVLNNNYPTGYYQVRSQMETFPTNVPPGYVNVIYKVDYRYTLYKTTDLISANQIGPAVYDTYYAEG